MTRVHSAEHILGVIITNEAWYTACSQSDLFCCCLIPESSVKWLYCALHFGHVWEHVVLSPSEKICYSVCHRLITKILAGYICLKIQTQIEIMNGICNFRDIDFCMALV